MKKFLTYTAIALVISLIPTSAMAIEYGGVGGKPANPRAGVPRSESIFIYELEPGQSFNDGVQVFNNSDTRKTIKVGAVDSIIASEGAFSCAQEADEKVGVGSWITLSKNEVTLDAGKNEVVNFTIKAPDNASVGEHGGCITVQDAEPPQNPENGGVVVSFRSAIRVAALIPGDIVKTITVDQVTLSPVKETPGKYSIRPSVTNMGNVSLDTNVDAKLVNLFGLTVANAGGTYPVLPKSTASWNFEVDQPFWGGWYRAVVDATYNSNTAESLGESTAPKPVTSSASTGFVFIMPHLIALIIELLLLAAIVTLIYLLIRKLRERNAVRKQWKDYTVKENDTIQSVAEAHSVSWKKLASINKVRAPYQLTPGSTLKVPSKKTTSKKASPKKEG